MFYSIVPLDILLTLMIEAEQLGIESASRVPIDEMSVENEKLFDLDLELVGFWESKVTKFLIKGVFFHLAHESWWVTEEARPRFFAYFFINGKSKSLVALTNTLIVYTIFNI